MVSLQIGKTAICNSVYFFIEEQDIYGEINLKPFAIPKKISLLRLDTDFYESTKKEMEVLYPRLQNKGVLIIDDYGHWKGSKKAVDDYFKNDLNFKFFHRIDYASRLYIKE